MDKKKQKPIENIVGWIVLIGFFAGLVLVAHNPATGGDSIWYFIAGFILWGIAGGFYLLIKKFKWNF